MATTLERYVNLVVQFGMTLVVSRLLTPAEFGIWAIGLAVANIIASAREFTSASYLIQRADLTREDVQGAFTVMLLMSVFVAAALVLGSSSIAAFYSEPRLISYLMVAALAILLEVIAAPLSALMRRDMAFGTLAVISIVNITVFSLMTIILAAWDFSYMSFAWAWVMAAASSGVLTAYYRPDLWVFKLSTARWRDMLAFGAYNGVNVFLFRLYETIPIVVLGRVLSLDAAGLYNRAILVCQLPDKIVLGGAIPVMLPALSAEVRAGRNLKAAYLHTIRFITALQWPALIVLAILAHPAVHLLLGGQWLTVVPLVQIIALASLFSFTAELNFPVLVSMGAMKDLLLRGLIAWPTSALIIAVSSFFGLTIVALSFFIIVPLQAGVSLYFIRRHVDVTLAEIADACRDSIAIAACSAAGPLAVVASLGFHFDLSVPMTFVAAISAAGGWLAGIWFTGHPMLDELSFAARTVKKLAVRVPRSLP